MLDVASQRKMVKARHKGHRELKNLMSSWDNENVLERSKSASRDRAVVVH